MASGHQDPDLRGGLVGAAGCVSLRSSHLQVISPCAIRKSNAWSLDIKNAFSQVDGFGRDGCLQAPVGWEPWRSDRIWKLKASAYGLNDAPVAFHRSLMRQILNSEAPMKHVGLRRQASTFESCVFLILRGAGRALGAFATHFDGVLGRGEPDVLPEIREYLEQHFSK